MRCMWRMGMNVLKQKHSSDRGPTSIKMSVDYFGVKIRVKKIEKLCGAWKEDGIGNQGLGEVLEKVAS